MKGPSESPWALRGDGAAFRVGNIAGEIRQAGEAIGLRHVTREGREVAAAMLAVTPPDDAPLPACDESYVRGADFITTHPAIDDWPFRARLRWTVEPSAAGRAVVVTLTASLQTDLLDSRPAIDVTTAADARAAIHRTQSTGRCVGWPADRGLWLAPHPSDLPEAALLCVAGTARVRLSPKFLEKGVIRSCRVAAVIATDVGASAEPPVGAFSDFASREAPLTA